MDHQLQIEMCPDGAAVVLRVKGELDLASSGTLRTCLEAVDDGFQQVVVDLADVSFIDSSGLNVLLAAESSHRADGRQVVLRQPSPQVRRLLDLGGVSQVITVVD